MKSLNGPDVHNWAPLSSLGTVNQNALEIGIYSSFVEFHAGLAPRTNSTLRVPP